MTVPLIIGIAAYIIVSKRINTRLFRINGGKPTNPPSGTVVDDEVTLPER